MIKRLMRLSNLSKEKLVTKINIPAVIFAGGKSSRMGKDKALLPFGRFETLVEFQYQRLKEIFETVSISWKSEKVRFGANSIFDEKSFSEISAPTVGLYSILKKIKTEYVFIISVDSPFFGETEISKLFQEIDNGYEIIVPQTEYGIEPLIAIYSKSLLEKIRTMLENGNHRLGKMIKDSNTKYVRFENKDVFTNLNYPEEYEKALEIV